MKKRFDKDFKIETVKLVLDKAICVVVKKSLGQKKNALFSPIH